MWQPLRLYDTVSYISVMLQRHGRGAPGPPSHPAVWELLALTWMASWSRQPSLRVFVVAWEGAPTGKKKSR